MNKNTGDKKHSDTFPKATLKPSRLNWLLWLIPLGAALLCGWFLYSDFIATGPTITIYFKNGEGVEEKNTPLKYRGATIGQVKNITLTQDKKFVEVKVKLAASATELAKADSIFWIVRPELSVGSISGLRTIISGEFIEVRPGQGARTNLFYGVEKEPLVEQPKALELTLLTENLGTLKEQSPIYYRGVQVGEIMYFQLAQDSRTVALHARIWEEYVPLVKRESKFWNAGGLDFHVGLFSGLEINAQSPRTIISGAIEFNTPPDYRSAASNGMVFVVSQKAEDAWKTWSPDIPLRLPAQAVHTNASPDLPLK